MKEIRLCENNEFDYVLGLCKKYNLGIEVQDFHNPYDKNKNELLKNYQEKLISFPYGRSFHAPYWDLCLGTKIIELQDVMIKIYNESYNIAKELKCTEMVIHNNYKPGTYMYDGWILRSKNLLKRLLEDKDNSITICIENQFESDSELLCRLIDEVNDPRVKICLDIGHANANSNMPVEEWIKSLKERISYYHLHNNHGQLTKTGYNKDDEHLGLANGTINIDKVLELSEEYTPNAIWNLECKGLDMEESLKYMKKYL